MNAGLPSLTLSAVEMNYLAGLLGAETLLGVPDPFPGWLAEEAAAVVGRVRADLIARKVIAVRDDGSDLIDAPVALLVGACAFPQAAFIVTYTATPGPAEAGHFFVTRQLCAELQLDETGAVCTLIAHPSPHSVYERILELLRPGPAPLADVAGGTIPQFALIGAQQAAQARGSEAASGVLASAGLPQNAAHALAESLGHPFGNGAVVAVACMEGAWSIAGSVALIQAQNALWWLHTFEREAQDWVDVKPATATEITAGIGQLMNRVLPDPLVFASMDGRGEGDDADSRRS